MATIVNGNQRNRPGKWIVDYRDPVTGKRRWITKDTREEAKAALGEVLTSKRTASYCSVDPDVTLSEYGDSVIAGRAAFVKPGTVESNVGAFKGIKSIIGNVKVKDLTPGIVISCLERLKSGGLENGTVRYKLEVLNVVLNRAKIDGVIDHNPAAGIGRRLNLEKDAAEDVKSFTQEERQRFLQSAEASSNGDLYRLLLGTGVRIGEALALRVDDIQGDAAVIDETTRGGRIGSTKSGVSRKVSLGKDLAERLKAAAETARQNGTSFLFSGPDGNPLAYETVRYDFSRVLKRAGLSAHFTPHCTRHTYASLLLSNGESIQYVQQQLGHTSIKLTVDVYGKWIQLQGTGVQERIDGGNT